MSWLDRFRHLTPPGAAGTGVGVPVDRRALVAAELEPVIAAAAACAADVAAVHEGATRHIDALRQRTDAAIEAMSAASHAAGAAEAARLLERAAHANERDIAAIDARARSESAAIVADEAARRDTVARDVVSRVRAMAGPP